MSDIAAALAQVEGFSVKAQEISSNQFLLWDYDRLSINPEIIKQVLFLAIRLSNTPANNIMLGLELRQNYAEFMCIYVRGSF